MTLVITPSCRTSLKIVHSIAACGWIGGGLAILILLKVAGVPAGQEEAEAFQRSIVAIDQDLIVPSALAGTLSGLVLARNRWGSREPRWIVGKCLLTALLLGFGAFWLKPDLQSLATQALEGADYTYHRHWLLGSTAALLQTAGLLLLVALSVIKPMKRDGARKLRSIPAGR